MFFDPSSNYYLPPESRNNEQFMNSLLENIDADYNKQKERFAQSRAAYTQGAQERQRAIEESYPAVTGGWKHVSEMIGEIAGNLISIMGVSSVAPYAIGPLVGAATFGNESAKAMANGATVDEAIAYAERKAELAVGMLAVQNAVAGGLAGFAPEGYQESVKYGLNVLGDGSRGAITEYSDPRLRRMTYDQNARDATLDEIARAFSINAGVGGVIRAAPIMYNAVRNAQSGLINGAESDSLMIGDGEAESLPPGAQGQFGEADYGGVEGRGRLTGSLDKLEYAERQMVDDLLNQGKNVEIIPRSNAQGVKTADFWVDDVKSELKSLNGTSLNTPVTRIQDGFKQGASTVIIDARGTGLTAEQANTVISRINGIYKNNVPGKIEIWTNSGTIYGGN